MRVLTTPLTLSPSSAMTANITSNAIDARGIQVASVQAIYTGSPVGTLKLQAANNLASPTWVDIADSSQAISAAGSFVWNINYVGFTTFRLVYTFTSGTGTLSALVCAKGE